MVLYKAGPQLLKVRFIIYLSILCALGSVWWGIDLAQHYGLNPGDGGVLAPSGVRLAWAVGVIVPGIAFVVGMWLYSRRYVARLEYDEQTSLYTVHHVWFFGTAKMVFHKEDIHGSRYHEGRLRAEVKVNAPWWTIHINGRQSPLILDAQGVMVEDAMMKKLLKR
jgi:hypothetical protein